MQEKKGEKRQNSLLACDIDGASVSVVYFLIQIKHRRETEYNRRVPAREIASLLRK